MSEQVCKGVRFFAESPSFDLLTRQQNEYLWKGWVSGCCLNTKQRFLPNPTKKAGVQEK